MPAAGINPVVDIARSHLRAKIESSAHGALNAAIPEGRFGRAALQIRIVRPFHCSIGLILSRVLSQEDFRGTELARSGTRVYPLHA
jgi:hypothetical protein